MLEQIDYIPKSGGAMVVRCYGPGPAPELPELIDGLPVTELADHCFAREPSVRVNPANIRRARRKGSTFTSEMCSPEDTSSEMTSAAAGETAGETTPPAAAGEVLREIRLPSTLRAVGDYAFYGCAGLRRVLFPSGLERLGGGTFVACNHIEEIVFEEYSREDGAGSGTLLTPPCMREAIADISYEVEAILTDRSGKQLLRLVFPGYFEESKENTPARIIEIKYLGTGYPYRQCFHGRALDLQAYDDGKLFYLATVNEFPETVLRLVLDRLETPILLSPEARERYLSWLRSEPEAAAAHILAKGDTGLLRLLDELSFFKPEILEVFIDKAVEKGNSSAASLLMELSHRIRPRRSGNRYSFD